MANRSVESFLTFRRPFSVGKEISSQPAGAYKLVIEEELIEGLSFLAYRRLSTVLEIPAMGIGTAVRQFIDVAPTDLDVALEKDAALVSDEETIHELYSRDSMMARARDFQNSVPD
ncbi:hypothetical protein IHQ71_30745 (plasmid) [Rhizobium sp. TH2]|uniref:hypothetical protein n=1 Tax=Rhizobium sp. TH2 TaxID=2775403 RepID=UPI002157CC2F|nr:hypothetical protein [Rhizobium sp. TH2]UVC12385.1 hypothetical protein IHQ71_30745 [Rhizobium sp. TH2]